MSFRRTLEKILFLAGIAVFGLATIAYFAGQIRSHMAKVRFNSGAQDLRSRENGSREFDSSADTSLWSEKRIHEYEATLAEHFDAPLGILRIERIHLEVPVFDGTDDRVLNRGVGRIKGTARAGENGNLGIAGHRDGFFRGLKDVNVGDTVQLELADGAQTYAIDSIEIVSPNDVRVLKSTSSPSLTLVTCYPFYFIGSAPQRYIVHASLSDGSHHNVGPIRVSIKASQKSKEK